MNSTAVSLKKKYTKSPCVKELTKFGAEKILNVILLMILRWLYLFEVKESKSGREAFKNNTIFPRSQSQCSTIPSSLDALLHT